MKTLFQIVCIAILAACCHAQAEPAGSKTAPVVDYPAVFKQAASSYQFKINERQAVAQMDRMLVQQYAAGRIATEKDAYLKTLYYQAAMYLMNGHPIAGGTVVAIARQQPAFRSSPAGRGMADFVDAMLSGDEDEDDELAVFAERTKKAQALLKSVRPAIQLEAQLRVIGEIYHDDVAVRAGEIALKQLRVTPAEQKIISSALAVK